MNGGEFFTFCEFGIALGVCDDIDEILDGEFMEDSESGEATEEFGDHSVFDEVFGLKVVGLEFWEVRIFGEADSISVGTESFLNDWFEVGESAGGDEEDSAGIDGGDGFPVDGVAQSPFE